MPACPLTVTWVCGQPKREEKEEATPATRQEEGGGRLERNRDEPEREGPTSSWEGGEGGREREERDYESIVLMKLRQAEERKQLCAELATSTNDTSTNDT